MKPSAFVTVLFLFLAAVVPQSIAKLGETHRANRELINARNPRQKSIAAKKVETRWSTLNQTEIHLPPQAGPNPEIEALEDPQTRIVGGEQVNKASRYPFFISWNGECGGSLIHPDIVLTAAHCNVIQADSLVVNAYELDNTNFPPTVVTTTEGAEVRNIVERVTHPSYNDYTIANDYLLLKLDSPVTTHQPISFNRAPSSPQVGEQLKTIGLGHTTDGGFEQPDFLREVVLTTVSDQSCDTSYSDYGGIQDDVMFCAGAPGGGKDSCQGDSGGPIFTLSDSGEVGIQVGIVSWGIGCANPDFPGVYSEISAVKDWIDEKICELSNDKPSNCQTIPGEEVDVEVGILTDQYPNEISWVLTDSAGVEIEKVEQYTYTKVQTEYTHELKLKNGATYTFTIGDSYGDGICCGVNGDGSYTVKAGDSVLASGGEFLDTENKTFVVGKDPHLQNCTDKTDTFAVSTSVGEQTCEWLNDNLDRYGFLCDFLDVAYTCPETCGACSIVRGQINTI